MGQKAKLSKTNQRRLDAALDGAGAIGSLVEQLTKDRLTSLYLRDMETRPDGYPSSSMPERSSGGGEPSTPTESVVIARTERVVVEKCGSCGHAVERHIKIVAKPVRDELRETLRTMERNIKEAERIVAVTVDSLSYITTVDEQVQGRATTTPCSVCNLLPATRSAWCENCYQDWFKHGKPDRLHWLLYKTQATNSEGIALVLDCPKPGPGGQATRGPWKHDK